MILLIIITLGETIEKRGDKVKRIIAFFDDDNIAKSTASALSERVCEGSKLTLAVADEDEFLAPGYAYKSTMLCSGAGTILGICASYIPGIGFFGTISPITGLIAGSVVGAVAGVLLDFLLESSSDYFFKMGLCAPEKSEGSIYKILRKRGAVSAYIEK